jgi:lipopolysaccharide transport system permease protein
MSKILDGVFHDLQNRYAGSFFGITWAFLYPAVLVCIYAVLFGQVYKTKPEDMETVQYVFLISAGLMPVIAFTEALSMSTTIYEVNRHLLHSTTIDPRLLPIRSTLVGQMSGFGGLIAVLIYMVITQHVTVYALMVPFFWVLYIGFLCGLCMIISLIAMRYRDVTMFVTVAGTLALVVSPTAFTYEMVPESLKLIMNINPLSFYIRGIQHAVAFNSIPPPHIFIGAIACTVVSLTAGFFFMEKRKHVYFDEI